MSEKQSQKDSSACAASIRNPAQLHLGIVRTIMLEKVRIIVGIRSTGDSSTASPDSSNSTTPATAARGLARFKTKSG